MRKPRPANFARRYSGLPIRKRPKPARRGRLFPASLAASRTLARSSAAETAKLIPAQAAPPHVRRDDERERVGSVHVLEAQLDTCQLTREPARTRSAASAGSRRDRRHLEADERDRHATPGTPHPDRTGRAGARRRVFDSQKAGEGGILPVARFGPRSNLRFRQADLAAILEPRRETTP